MNINEAAENSFQGRLHFKYQLYISGTNKDKLMWFSI